MLSLLASQTTNRWPGNRLPGRTRFSEQRRAILTRPAALRQPTRHSTPDQLFPQNPSNAGLILAATEFSFDGPPGDYVINMNDDPDGEHIFYFFLDDISTAAVVLGTLGGSKKSASKTAACIANGALGDAARHG